MKNTILWSALFTLACAHAQADTQPTTTSTPAVQGTQPTTTTPAQPAATVQPTPAPQPVAVINCDYKIAPSIKSIDQSLVLSWAEKATTQAFDLNPTTLDTQMQSLKNCFTEQGWTGFNTALQKSGNLDAIKAQQLTVSSHVDGQATIDEAKDNQWKMTLPVQVVYQNDKEKVTQLLTIKLTVGRKVSGDLGITQMIATPRTSAAAGTTHVPAATTPADTTSAPTTATPQGTPTTPSANTAPTIADPGAQPSTSNTPVEPQKPTTTTSPTP